MYKFFPARRTASASIFSELVSSESNNVSKLKVDGASLLCLLDLLKVIEYVRS